MKLRTVAGAAFIGIATMSSAQACISPCNFTGVNINMGNVSIGQTGTIFEDLALYPEIYNDLGYSLAFGYIPSNSEILFTYAFTGLQANPTNALTSSMTYNYVQGGNTYAGFSNGDSLITSGPFGAGVLSQQGSINGVSSVSQVFATASLPSLTSGNTSISNNTSGLQQFATNLLGYFDASPPGTVTITYQVTGVGPSGLPTPIGGTPLPASLPMMLVAMGGLFGFARVNSQRKALAA